MSTPTLLKLPTHLLTLPNAQKGLQSFTMCRQSLNISNDNRAVWEVCVSTSTFSRLMIGLFECTFVSVLMTLSTTWRSAQHIVSVQAVRTG